MRTAAALFSAALLGGCASTDRNVNYGLNHYQMGLYGQAIPALRSAAASLEDTSPPDARLPEVLGALGDMAADTKRFDLAESYLRKAVKAADELAKPDEAAQRNALVRSGKFYLGQNRPAEALPLLERAAAISERNPGLQRTLHAIDLDNVGIAHSNQGRLAEGRAFGLRALKVLDEAQGEPAAAATRGVVLFNLAYGYMEESRYAEAEANYRRALEILAPSGAAPIAESWRARVLIDSYAGMLRKLGRTDEAAALERRKEQLNRR